jgi:hypothetical protein
VAQPNTELGNLIERAGLSWAGLARRINDLAAGEEGLALRYDYTSVHRWVRKGERPRHPVPNLIARVLSERLGSRVVPADFGMINERSLASRSLAYHVDESATVETIVEIGRADVKRRNVISAPFVLAALAGPSRDWLLASLASLSGETGPRKVGFDQVAGIRDMFALFQEMDVMRGGGHARVALVEYLNSWVLPLVRRDHGDHQVKLALYEAASEQAYLVGWMAYDDGSHGLAQRYLIQSLRLAQASGSRALGAHVLAGMSDQANLLGHPREALALARTGQTGITVDDSPACLADLQILEARALAALGEAKPAAAAVARAERTFARVQPDNEPEWARFIDAAYLYGEAAHCFRDIDDPSGVDQFATASAEAAAQQRRARRGALSNAALAVGLLSRGQPEAAADKARQVVDLTAAVNSTRCLQAVTDLTTRLAPYRHLAEVQAFHHHAHDRLGIA